MNQYIATFFTHCGASISKKSLEAKGLLTRLASTPRSLSASCTACLIYYAKSPHEELMHEDVECIYTAQGSGFELVYKTATSS